MDYTEEQLAEGVRRLLAKGLKPVNTGTLPVARDVPAVLPPDTMGGSARIPRSVAPAAKSTPSTKSTSSSVGEYTTVKPAEDISKPATRPAGYIPWGKDPVALETAKSLRAQFASSGGKSGEQMRRHDTRASPQARVPFASLVRPSPSSAQHRPPVSNSSPGKSSAPRQSNALPAHKRRALAQKPVGNVSKAPETEARAPLSTEEFAILRMKADLGIERREEISMPDADHAGRPIRRNDAPQSAQDALIAHIREEHQERQAKGPAAVKAWNNFKLDGEGQTGALSNVWSGQGHRGTLGRNAAPQGQDDYETLVNRVGEERAMYLMEKQRVPTSQPAPEPTPTPLTGKRPPSDQDWFKLFEKLSQRVEQLESRFAALESRLKRDRPAT